MGPGCISIAITLGAHLRHQAGPGFEHGYPRHFIAGLIGMFLLCLLVLICYSDADRLLKWLGKSGTNIMTGCRRLFGSPSASKSCGTA